METIILVIQTIVAVILALLILVQSKGKGFGRAWGGSTSFTRRGLERLVFKSTFVFSAIFVIVSIFSLAV